MFPALGRSGLDRAEVYFMDGARAMVETGDWLVPLYRGEPFFDKPALTYWLMALAFRVFGFDPGVARLVPAVSALLVLLAAIWLGRLLFDRGAAFAGAVVLATSVGFMSFGRVGMSDMLMTLWTTLAAGLALVAFREPAPAWAVPALGVVLGLGFQTKGPIAILIPAFAVALLVWRRRRMPVTAAGAATAALLFAVLGLGWFALVYLRLGGEPLTHFFLRENIERFAADTYDAGRWPFFYLGAYAVQGAPWSLLLPIAAWRGLRGPASGREGTRFLLLWVGLVLVPLSLSRGKIDYYLLPLLPALSLVVGHWLASLPWSARDRSWARAAVAVVGTGLALTPLALARVPQGWLPSGPRSVLAGLMLACAAALLAAAARVTPGRALAALAGASGLCAACVFVVVVPAFRDAQPNQEIVRAVSDELRRQPDAGIALCHDTARVQRDILFFTRVPVEERCELWAVVAARRPYLLLLDRRERASFRRGRRLRVVLKAPFLPAALLSPSRLLTPRQPETVYLVANYAESGRLLRWKGQTRRGARGRRARPSS